MRCPKCGARIPRGSNVCFKCGTNTRQIKEASHQAVKEARANYDYDKIVLTTAFPSDLSYVKTLLMCIFLGLFGGHYFYVKRNIPGIIYLVITLVFLAFILIPGFVTGFAEGTMPIYTNPFLNFLFIVSCMAEAVIVVFWITDIIKVATKHFNVPVVLKEK